MASTWHDIDRFYAWLLSQWEPSPYREATEGIASLVRYLADDPLGNRLFGFTSMHELCVHQTERHPFADPDPHPFANMIPFLRISPMHSGLVEFRYVDHLMSNRHWVRVESPDRTIARFDHFLDALHWFIEERASN